MIKDIYQPRKLISLWDMMQILGSYAPSFLDALTVEKEYVKKKILTGNAKPGLASVKDRERAIQLFDFASHWCKSLKLDKADSRIYRFRIDSLNAQSLIRYAPIHAELCSLRQAIISELEERKFVFIPLAKVEFFEKAALFGKRINYRFPSAKLDIKAAGNCLALDLPTAAIFHLMRVVEIGLRALARQLKVKIKNTPLEYAEWNRIITEIEKKIEVMRQMPRGPKKETELVFYRDLVGAFNAFKDVWRNNVMHTRGTYNEHEALGVFERVRGFMQRLANKVSE